MADRLERLITALALFEYYGSAKKIERGLEDGFGPVRAHLCSAPPSVEEAIVAEATDLADRGVDVVLSTDDGYPQRLRETESPPPVLFVWGDISLLHAPGVGMCGSRHVSEEGLVAARSCGFKVARNGLTVISGYAKGVDTETHLAALDAGGNTVIVLAEGIRYFRVKKVFKHVEDIHDRVLVVSQFPPRQRWNVGAAMTRNGIIAGLGSVLVVIEAGDTGGTLNAGKQALSMGRPVVALEFSGGTPAGNRILHTMGAYSIRTPGDLGEWLTAMAAGDIHMAAGDIHLEVESATEQLALSVESRR